ncbi:hypothetical protein [Flavobacterium psychrophilum]|uniref:hypothetical protein n=1 Tax=Flavobacterium psychrophilum TaxID=96345 RepID=UPI000B7C5499|nr:hypothetical protein [Flavobacterium psychrophilum]MCB6089134.1 hypothetical protein [Flavobacterium psychrophilum]MCB6231833.1 hypothetical protein [Flavobacterium psychrophilum]MEB3380333.1 hypothetical protein [Flavobacterium psychrophilum]SNA77842.1 conserved hypothetical protein [Flavobacterium psychrophilum]SNA87975.1 conserved hypothetical protein [Flavobacterium psychrophilum]
MKKLFSLLFLFVVLVGTLVGCKTANVLPPTIIEKNNTITKKEVVHDTIFETQKDSSYYKAWLDCQDGKVVFKTNIDSQKPKVETKKGNYLQPPKVNLKDNILTVDCEAEAQKMYAKWKDTYILESRQSNTSKPVLVERQLTWWQKFQIWCGRIFLVITLFSVVKFLIKFYKPI